MPGIDKYALRKCRFRAYQLAYHVLAYQSENLGFRVNQLGNQHW